MFSPQQSHGMLIHDGIMVLILKHIFEDFSDIMECSGLKSTYGLVFVYQSLYTNSCLRFHWTTR